VYTGLIPQYYADGGVKDRTGLTTWSTWSTNPSALIHLVDSSRSSQDNKIPVSIGSSGSLSIPNGRTAYVVRTPKSKASFFSLRDYQAQKDEAYRMTVKSLLHTNFNTFITSNS
jgi:hypothetical protein